MSIIDSLILGIVQGLTEFLPISSSGHLVIAQKLLGLTIPPLFFDVVVHLGTLTAIIAFFYQDLIKITFHQIKLLAIATFPAIIVGLFLEPIIDKLFNSLIVVAIGLLITSVLLFLTKKPTKYSSKIAKPPTVKQSLIIGLFQALAIIPGISRSGSTVSAGLFTGLKRQIAFSFSFLLAIPAILGALVLQLANFRTLATIDPITSLLGFTTSMLTGFFALKILKKVIDKSKLHFFAIYCLVLSACLFINLFL